MSYTRHTLGESYLFGEIRSVYPTTPADWATSAISTIIFLIINSERGVMVEF